MSVKTNEGFQERVKCFVDRFAQFKVHGEYGEIGTVDARLTLDENIADVGGVAIAWDAYRKHMETANPKTFGEEDQVFFLAYAQSYCTQTQDSYRKQLLYLDPHAPPQWRVNGALMNNKDFARVFNCDDNSPMNPIDKCSIW